MVHLETCVESCVRFSVNTLIVVKYLPFFSRNACVFRPIFILDTTGLHLSVLGNISAIISRANKQYRLEIRVDEGKGRSDPSFDTKMRASTAQGRCSGKKSPFVLTYSLLCDTGWSAQIIPNIYVDCGVQDRRDDSAHTPQKERRWRKKK